MAATTRRFADFGFSRVASPADTTTITDSAAKTPRLAKAETVIFTDVAVKQSTLRSPETLALSEALSKLPKVTRSETLSLIDSRASALFVARNESILHVDSFTKTAKLSLTEGLIVSDAVRDSLALILSDSSLFSDSISKVLAVRRSVAENLAVADESSLAAAIRHVESLPLVDVPNRTSLYDLNINESIEVADFFAYLRATQLNLGDPLNISDALHHAASLGKLETLVLLDSLLHRIAFNLSLHDSITGVDTPPVVPVAALVAYPAGDFGENKKRYFSGAGGGEPQEASIAFKGRR